MDNYKPLDNGSFTCDIDGKTYLFHHLGSYPLHERTPMKTALTLLAMFLMAFSLMIILFGCGPADHRRADSPVIGEVMVVNANSVGQPATVGSTIDCRADVSTRYSTDLRATATFVLNGVRTPVQMNAGVASLTITPLLANSVSVITCEVAASVLDSLGVSRVASNSIQIVPQCSYYTYPQPTYYRNAPYQQPYQPTRGFSFGFYFQRS